MYLATKHLVLLRFLLLYAAGAVHQVHSRAYSACLFHSLVCMIILWLIIVIFRSVGYNWDRDQNTLYKINFLTPSTYEETQKICQFDGGNLAAYGTMSQSGMQSMMLHAHALAASYSIRSSKSTLVAGKRVATGQWQMPDGEEQK